MSMCSAVSDPQASPLSTPAPGLTPPSRLLAFA
jgi:hypothetical protein